MSNINRAWVIGDVHFGIHSNSIDWLDIHKEYFNNFLMPTIIKNKKDGDVLFILGDVFDSRQSINVLILNEALNIFNELVDIIPIYIILGNHDVYYKNTNEVNSLKVLKYINNIYIIDTPTILKTNNNKYNLLMLPWIEQNDNFNNIVGSDNSDFLFCHSQFINMNYNQKIKINEGIDVPLVEKYKNVYSGHIHLSQKYNNIIMVGNIFQMTRNDANNDKYIYIIDFDNDNNECIVNDYSPKFIKIDGNEALTMDDEYYNNIINNNFVDIIIPESNSLIFPFDKLIEKSKTHRKIEYMLAITQNEIDININNNNIEDVDLKELINNYIDDLDYPINIKNIIKNYSDKLWKTAIKKIDNNV